MATDERLRHSERKRERKKIIQSFAVKEKENDDDNDNDNNNFDFN